METIPYVQQDETLNANAEEASESFEQTFKQEPYAFADVEEENCSIFGGSNVSLSSAQEFGKLNAEMGLHYADENRVRTRRRGRPSNAQKSLNENDLIREAGLSGSFKESATARRGSPRKTRAGRQGTARRSRTSQVAARSTRQAAANAAADSDSSASSSDNYDKDKTYKSKATKSQRAVPRSKLLRQCFAAEMNSWKMPADPNKLRKKREHRIDSTPSEASEEDAAAIG